MGHALILGDDPFGAKATIHSLSANRGPNCPDRSNTDTATIIGHKDNNRVIAGYQGIRKKAVFNSLACY
jgi:hypothetical protein